MKMQKLPVTTLKFDMFDLYKHKIKTIDELAPIVLNPPRKHKVVMCQGCFDLVHPGHIRHFLYAKQHGSVLIVAVTSDRFINKGKYRPHVPQDLRALNLAALDVVDYVVINDEKKPVELIEKLKPDFYAKGFEYNETQRNGKSIEETSLVQSYGGELIFTPGDFVYSSSAVINTEAPDLSYEKLRVVMDRYDISFDDLKEVLSKTNEIKVHVVGDTIVDSYTHCSMIGGQTKTPTISAKYEYRKDYVGGAGIVAKHIKASGSDVIFSTVLGNDEFGVKVLDDLESFGITLLPHVDPLRPTTNKNAIVIGDYRMLKVDTLDNRTISDEILQSLTQSISETKSDILIFSDFRHGIFNQRTIPSFIKSIPNDVLKIADSQVASRWGNITEFVDFDLITPNEREARFALADQDSGVRPLASSVYDQSRCKVLMLKLAEKGMIVCINPDHQNADSFFVIDSFANDVIDPVGAGDALLAYASIALKISNNPAIAAILGTFAAAIECEVDGNIPVTVEQMIEKINCIEEMSI